MQKHDEMVCEFCGKENPFKYQDFCVRLECSGRMIEHKYFAHNKKLSKNEYRINIHAHSYFSDGANSPYHMALKAKELGFTALVITDHYYGPGYEEYMHVNKLKFLRKACVEAKEVLPVIIGLEIPIEGNEVLIFGGEVIKRILENGLPTLSELYDYKADTNCAIILCHPAEEYTSLINVIDGYEHFNGGNNWFTNREPKGLEGKQVWCNSDAHMTKYLDNGYNIVDTKIQYEADLIKYIKKGKQHTYYCKNKS